MFTEDQRFTTLLNNLKVVELRGFERILFACGYVCVEGCYLFPIRLFLVGAGRSFNAAAYINGALLWHNQHVFTISHSGYHQMQKNGHMGFMHVNGRFSVWLLRLPSKQWPWWNFPPCFVNSINSYCKQERRSMRDFTYSVAGTHICHQPLL